MEKIRFIDLFSGIGAFHQALSDDKYECVLACDIDKYCREVYKKNYDVIPEGDIKELREIPNHDILCAGFPCQPFSISGKQEGFSDDRGDLFFEVYKIIKKKKPEIVLLENVKNLVTHDNGNTLQIIIELLEKENYYVSYKVINAVDFGLPQKRERLYIVANKKQKFNFPNSNNITKKYLKDIIDYSDDKFLQKEKLINLNPDDKEQKLQLKPLRIGIIKKGGQGDRIYSDKGVAITISASSGGTGSKTGLYYINGGIRRLNLLECARIQGFPDDFKTASSKTQSYKQFGNSIPVNVLKSIVKEVEKQITGENYE